MSASTRETIWARLQAFGLVEGEMPALDADHAPWYVRVMLGFAGWIGALFLLGFVWAGFAFVIRSGGASLVVGASACAAAAALFRIGPRGDFTAQFGLAVSLAGQALMVFGLFQWFERSMAVMGLAVALQQALLFALVPHFVHRVWTAWSGTCAVSLALLDMGLHSFALAGMTAALLAVWLHEFDFSRRGELVRAGGYGLTLAAIQAAIMHGGLWHAWIWGRRTSTPFDPKIIDWLGAAATGVVLLWGMTALLRREGVAVASRPGKIALTGAAILALVSLKAPGLGPAAAILIVGHANGNRVLVGLGIAALLGYLSHYYYSLEATLLEKSSLLACAGLALLAVRFAVRRWWPYSKEHEHA